MKRGHELQRIVNYIEALEDSEAFLKAFAAEIRKQCKKPEEKRRWSRLQDILADYDYWRGVPQ